MADKRTMTLNLNDDEMDALDALSSRYDMSKTAIIRKALRLPALAARFCHGRRNGEKPSQGAALLFGVHRRGAAPARPWTWWRDARGDREACRRASGIGLSGKFQSTQYKAL